MILGQFGLGCLFGSVWDCFRQLETVWDSLGACLGTFGYMFRIVCDSLGAC